MIKKVWINDRVEEIEVSEEELNSIPDVIQEPTDVEVLKAQTSDLNLQIIDLWETLLGAGVI